MPEIGAIVEKVRSKNAGPFWLTIDIFCGSRGAFDQVRQALSNARVAATFQMDADLIKRFEIPGLNVVKFSFPRPEIQGTRQDRDMHGASWAVLIAEMQIN